MSAMKCALCERIVDTDADPDSLYTITAPQLDCVCAACRSRHDIATEFDEVTL